MPALGVARASSGGLATRKPLLCSPAHGPMRPGFLAPPARRPRLLAPPPPAALKYRLACGALVFKVPSKWVEFYEPGLEAGVHYVELPPYEHEGGDAKRYVQEAGGAESGWGDEGVHVVAWGH